MASAHASSSRMAAGWANDKRGYPERTFDTLVLPVSSSAISFDGHGVEPYEQAAVTVAEGSQAQTSLRLASTALAHAHIVAFPTETVYGLAANALDAEATSKIFRAKGRPVDNPLIVHISDLAMLRRLVPDAHTMSPAYRALVHAFWPGALTLLMPVDEAKVPSVVRCGLKTLGVRMPSHPVARALIALSQLPLAAPSANASGRPSPTTAAHVYRDMTTRDRDSGGVQGRLPYVLDGGPCDVGVESTVVDGVTDEGELRVLRPGGVGVEAIEAVLRERGLLDGAGQDAVRLRVYGRDMARDQAREAHPTTPGMKYRHYSPDADVVLLVDSAGRAMTEEVFGTAAASPAVPLSEAIGEYVAHHPRAATDRLTVGVMSMDDSGLTRALVQFERSSTASATPVQRFSLGSTHSPEQAAQRLFQGLRALDEGDEGQGTPACDIIFVEAPVDDTGVGLAIMNRLQKAAGRVVHVLV